jgi:hypothetical protein
LAFVSVPVVLVFMLGRLPRHRGLQSR